MIRSLASRALLLGSSLLIGCGGLTVKVHEQDAKKPNNVWMFFSVKDGDNGVANLTADDFVIYEDDKLVSKFESKQVIQNPEVSAVMYTMLLLDFSGSITESDSANAVVDAAKAFSDRIGERQKVAVFVFDGEEKIHSVVPFTEAKGSVEGGLEGLRTRKPRDPSTNLHGAVVQGLQELKTGLDKDQRPLKFGTLVVFSDGTDRAARVSRQDMMKEIDHPDYEDYELYAIGVGAEIDKSDLENIGRDGTELATDKAKVQEAFDRVAARVESHMKSFYLLSYCTPARNGVHEVTVEVRTKEDKSGKGETNFDASGFGPPPDCNPETPPTFDVKRGGTSSGRTTPRR